MKTVTKKSANPSGLPQKLSNAATRTRKLKAGLYTLTILFFFCASSVHAQSKISIRDFSKENPKKNKVEYGDSTYVHRQLTISEKIDKALKEGKVQAQALTPRGVRPAKEQQVLDSILIERRRTFNKSEVPVAMKSEMDRWSKKKEK